MNESVLERVLLWMVSGLAGDDLAAACIAKLNVPAEQVKDVIAEARRKLTLAAEYNRDEMLGTALTRLNDLYSRCIRQQNEAKALDVQREINRLAGLYRSGLAVGPGNGGATAATESETELEAVGDYLLPLALADPSLPLREHARLAVVKIQQLTQAGTPVRAR